MSAMSFPFSIRIDSVRVNEIGVDGCGELGLCVEPRVGDCNELGSCVELMVCDWRCAIKSVGSTENKFAAEVTAVVDALNELPFAPPLLHGSLADHGSMPLEFTEVPSVEFSASSKFLFLRLSSSDS